MRSWVSPGIAVGSLLVLFAVGARAQEPAPTISADTIPLVELPSEVAQPVVDFFNDPATIQFTGRVSVPHGTEIVGNVAVIGGPVFVAGRITGDLVIVDGDLELSAGSIVEGDVTVIAGVVRGLAESSVSGEVVTYSQRLRYRRQDGRIVYVAAPSPELPGPRANGSPVARADLIIATGGAYNRVEGLPISVGPVLESGGEWPFRMRAEAIYRTESGATLDPDRMGYRVRAEQAITRGGELRIGGTLSSVIEPIEGWHLESLENSLATFLLHKDFRDHFERRGASGYLSVRPQGQPWTIRLQTRSERHRTVPSGSPWTVFRNQDLWRRQPLVAEGWLTSLRLEGRYDTRSAPYDPASGWLVSGAVERSVRSSLRQPESVPVGAGADAGVLGSSAPEYPRVSHGILDLRRYNRLSPESRLNLRLLLAGSLDGAALPAQRQHALGGEGSLPGYMLFRLDCGARSAPVYRGGERPPIGTPGDDQQSFFPAYGCDRVALAQAEFRGRLGLRLGLSDGAWVDAGRALDLGWAASPDWVAFLGAGTGWSRHRPDEDLAVDFGVGILFHRIGLYAAVPLRGEGGLNVFMRLGPRF
jgi:hypothetical protein